MWDAEQFCNDYNIESFPYSTQGGPNWLNIQCPMGCGDSSDHGKLHLGDGGYHCWKCGSHKTPWVIHILTGVPYKKCKDVFQEYSREGSGGKSQNDQPKVRASSIELPGTTLQKQHIRYLLSRGIDSVYSESVWGIRGTGIVGDFRNRIIFPFFVNGNPVTYQSRNMYEKSYKMLEPELSVIPAKELLYGEWLVSSQKRIVVCEGPFDAINMGVGFVATCGTGHTPHQVKILKVYEKVYIFFDPEPQAQIRALKLAGELSVLGVDVENICYQGKEDPGELKPDKVKSIRKELGFDG